MSLPQRRFRTIRSRSDIKGVLNSKRPLNTSYTASGLEPGFRCRGTAFSYLETGYRCPIPSRTKGPEGIGVDPLFTRGNTSDLETEFSCREITFQNSRANSARMLLQRDRFINHSGEVRRGEMSRLRDMFLYFLQGLPQQRHLTPIYEAQQSRCAQSTAGWPNQRAL